MILIADSGATKTDWWVGDSLEKGRMVQTQGLNPFHLSEEQIERIISDELMPQLKTEVDAINAVYFYGAGCVPQKVGIIKRILQCKFRIANVEVEPDLLGAARALCGNSAGVACILGTGANSCLYDGRNILSNTPPLGYILGDEGSGAYLGKRFIGDCLKGILPQDLADGLLDEMKLTIPELLDRVYRQPQAARFLASVAPYIYNHKTHRQVRPLLEDCFSLFFVRNVMRYAEHPSVCGGQLPPVSFVGSVAWYFQDEIKSVARRIGANVGCFVKEPIKRLIEYHLSDCF